MAHVSFLGSTNVPAAKLAERLCGLFPADTLTRVFFSDNGSTAIEVALKMAVQYWQLRGHSERCRFLAFDRAYHGDTAGASSVGGIAGFHGRFAEMHFPVQRIGSTAELPEPAEHIAAIIIEPLVQGAAGIRLWPEGMLRELRAWCDRHGVFLILDEVMTGFGRTGAMFACEREGVIPDFPASRRASPAVICRSRRHSRRSACSRNFSARSRSRRRSTTATATREIRSAARPRSRTSTSSATSACWKISSRRLRASASCSRRFPCTARARDAAVRIHRGIEIGADKETPYEWTELRGARVCMAARKHGLLTRPVLDTIVLMPPYCFTDEQLVAAVEAIRLSIDEVCG